MLGLNAILVAGLLAVGASTSPTPDQWPPHGYSYQETVLRHHNVHRANHSAPAIQWGPNMYNAAKTIAQKCVYQHDTSVDGGGYGQNIAAGTPPNYISQVITTAMYNAEMPWFNGQYGKASPDFTNFEHYGHFSQIVWKGSSHVGCFTADCSAHGLIDPSTGQNVAKEGIPPYFTVCNYWPAGNVGGAWASNIGRPLGHPTVTAQY